MSEASVVKTPELKISIAIGAALVVQSALALIWAGSAAERIAQLEQRTAHSTEIIERTARVEEQITAMRASLARIESKIDRERK